MDKTLKIYIAALIGVIVLIVVQDMYKTTPTNWKPSYSLDKKNPLDLYVFNHEVEKIFPNDKLKRVTATPFEYFRENKEPANFLIINENMYNLADSVILEQVSKGSNLWISAENFMKSFTDTLNLNYSYVENDFSLEKQDSVKLTLTMSNWSKKHFYLHPVFNTYSFVAMDKATTTILGKMEMPDGELYPNFVRVKFGKGTIFLHNQPEVFSNVAMLYPNSSADYVSHVLSYIPQDKPLIWFVQGQTRNTGRPVNETALSVIFRYPALRMTWLLFIYGILLYLLFNAKRRQRIVPVVKPLKNTTVEFVQTIGNLYFQEGSTSNILGKKIIYFLDRIRHTYYLDTGKLDYNFAEKLQNKSGKDKVLIDAILTCISDFQKLKTSVPSDLIKLNNLIEEFWNDEN
ncbi:MAG: hypothetical protein PHT07_06020 [Paludibacter sp.]|nr:hypothetical protein [Paludibacter sp.]